jgi:predicted Zn-dependent peptidase
MTAAELGRAYDSFDLGPGTRLHVYPTAKWKTVCVDIFVRRALDRDAALFALLPHILKRGTRRFGDRRAMTRRLEELYGASMASDILKIGESQVLSVRLEIPNPKYVSGAPRLLEDGLDLVADVLFDPRTDDGAFPRERVEQEKRNLVHYIEGVLNDKAVYATERCCEEMCRGEPFGLYEYGRPEDVRAIDARGLYGFYREAIDRSPVDIFVAGDIEPEAARRLFAERFGRPRRGDLAPAAGTPHPAPRAIREVIERRAVRQAKLVFGLRSEITARDDDFPALLVANAVLGGFPHSKLFRIVREQEGLCYYASSSLEKTKGVVFISCGIEAGAYPRARALIEAQIEAVRGGDLSEEEVARTRRAIARNFTTIADSAPRLATHWYTGILNGRPQRIADAIEAVERVPRAEIAAAARRLRLDTVYLLAGNN